MERRDLLRAAGLGSFAALAGPALLAACTQATAGGTTFFFIALSQGKKVGAVSHRAVLRGAGRFTDSTIEGTGTFIHFDDGVANPPKPVLAAGKWKATKLVKFTPKGDKTEGVQAGILEMLVDVTPNGKPTVSGATLRVVCNIGFAGIQTGEPEGFTFEVPGSEAGRFEQIVVQPGVTPGLSYIGDPLPS